MAKLICIAGNNEGDEFPLTDGVNTIGRSPQCDIVLFDKKCSRNHCEVFQKGSHCHIEDTGSRHGTSLNGKRLKRKHALKSGDKVQVGVTVLKMIGDRAADVVERVVEDAESQLRKGDFDDLIEDTAIEALKTRSTGKRKQGGLGGFFRSLFGGK